MSSVLKQVAALFSDKAALGLLQGIRNGVSDTEWAALASGTVGFEGSIFGGNPDWDALMETPKPSLTEEEQAFMDNEVEEFCAMINDWEIRDKIHDLPEEGYQFLKDHGFFGLIIPKEYGGKGFSAQAHSAIVGKIGSRSNTAAVVAMVPNSLGPAELLMNYGTEDQKDYYLPKLASGEFIPCFALTSEIAGSDATSLADTGEVYKDDDGGLKLRMNWAKRYITLAPVASLFGVAYRMKIPKDIIAEVRDNPEASTKDDLVKLLGDDFTGLEGEELSAKLAEYLENADPNDDLVDRGITLSLVPADTPGIKRDVRHRPGGAAFPNGPNWGKDVEVPLDSIIGGPEAAGFGWNMLVDCLSIGRSISLPATAAGGLKYLSRVTGAYAAVRNQFGYADKNGQIGMPLAKMEGVQEPLTRIAGFTYIVDSARHLPLQELDIAHDTGTKARPSVPSAILKYNATQMSWLGASDAMAVHAGKGVVEGPNNPVAHIYQGSPIGQTVEGANSLTRTMITFGQGAFLVHPHTMDEMHAAEAGDAKAAGKHLRKHLMHVFNETARSFFGAFGLGHGNTPSNGPDTKYYKQINRLSSNFAAIGNVTMLALQKAVKGKQRISGRLADTLSNMYMASQVLRRWENDGRPEEDRALMEWSCQHLLHEAEQSLIGVLDNFPSKLTGAFVKALVFPRGPRLKPPSDALSNKVAQIITTPGPARDRLTDGIFIPQGEKEYVARLERAFDLAHEAAPFENALARGLKKGTITPSDSKADLVQQAIENEYLPEDTDVEHAAKLLEDTQAARQDIIAVDCFNKDWVGDPVNPTGPIVP